MRLCCAWLALALAVIVVGPASAQSKRHVPKVIVLIGGDIPHNPGVHEAQRGIAAIADMIATAPAFRHAIIRVYPRGWPDDPAAFKGASTVLWYFDGLEHHPLLDPARRDAFGRMMERGVGLVTLHQASTLPPGDKIVDLIRWLGGARDGMVDRTVEVAAVEPTGHPTARGIGRFSYRDEFYPTLQLAAGTVPVLTADLHLEAAPSLPPTRRTIAWAYRRPGGGRAFGFTGAHYLTSFDQPEVRKLVLNAIAWTAGMTVPSAGIASDPASSSEKAP